MVVTAGDGANRLAISDGWRLVLTASNGSGGLSANQNERRGEAARRVFGLKKQRAVVSGGRRRRCSAAVRDGGALPVLLCGGGGWQCGEQTDRDVAERVKERREQEPCSGNLRSWFVYIEICFVVLFPSLHMS